MRNVPAVLLLAALFAIVSAEDVIIGSQESASSYPYCGS
jgi:hypothetical protein